ncbi:MAG TPA: DsbA family protein, partial [Candidatus Binataceae bacterium]|nr:DsbA family protein [Candidatus Binataceae bacterium]
ALRATLAVPALAGANPADYSNTTMGAFAQALMRSYWERDEDISDRAVIGAVAEQAGLDRQLLLAAADSERARADLASVTERAAARGVFGAPTFFVGDEMFWGKDRLDFVERWLSRG